MKKPSKWAMKLANEVMDEVTFPSDSLLAKAVARKIDWAIRNHIEKREGS